MNDNIPFEDRVITQGNYWTAYLEPDQYTLGSSYLWLKRNNGEGHIVRELCEIPRESNEFSEYLDIRFRVESAIKAAFHADRINYSELGNRTPELHPKLFPRYIEDIEFEGITFEDVTYPGGSAERNEKTSLSSGVFCKMRDRIIASLD